jgi:transcriptional regulator
MYQPSHFREDRLDVLHALIRAHPLATVVTAGAGGLMANMVPMVLAPDGSLHGHLARANRQLAALGEGAETLLVFHGPQAYVRPSWYPSKAEHGRVVPTWNYVVVQARGTPRLIEDPARLKAYLEAITASQEQAHDHPWTVDDAPADYTERMIAGITGFAIAVTAIEGKWKVSQNRADPDRLGVAEGLARQGRSDISTLVLQRGAGGNA